MKDKRKYPRVSALNMISLQKTGENGILNFDAMGRTLDISAGGALCETVMHIPEETLLELNIQNEEDILTIKGRVVHSRENTDEKYETGIKFIDLTPEESSTLSLWVKDSDV